MAREYSIFLLSPLNRSSRFVGSSKERNLWNQEIRNIFIMQIQVTCFLPVPEGIGVSRFRGFGVKKIFLSMNYQKSV